MNSIWSSLLWKEWREHRRVFSLLAIASSLSVLAPWLSHNAHDSLWWPVSLVAGVIPAACLFLGAGVASSEQSNRTIGFLQSLPSDVRKAAIAKLLIATGVVLTPTAILGAIWWIWRQWNPGLPPDVSSGIALQQLFVGGLAALSLLLWMAAVGVNQRDEVRAGAIGLLVMLCIWAAIGLVTDSRPPASTWIQVAAAAAPGGVVFAYTEAKHLLPFSAISQMLLVAWYVCRFGRVAPPRTPAAESFSTLQEQVAELRPPRRGPTRALLWKQFRETGPLALLGAGCTLCVAAVIARVVGNGAQREEFLFDALPLIAIAWVMVSYFVALIAGVGLFADDLKPPINHFWRSRPMALTRWFSVKYASALVITLVALSTPMILIAGGFLAAYGVETIQKAMPEQPPLAMLTVEVAALAAAFTVAAAATAWFRQPVLAAIVAILATVVAVWVADSYITTYEQGFATLVIATSLAALLAWQAVRRDLSLTAN